MSLSHLIILGIIALIVIPPDKLPEVARQLARILNELKRSTSGIWDDIKRDAAFRPEDFLKPPPPNPQNSSKAESAPVNSEQKKTHE